MSLPVFPDAAAAAIVTKLPVVLRSRPHSKLPISSSHTPIGINIVGEVTGGRSRDKPSDNRMYVKKKMINGDREALLLLLVPEYYVCFYFHR